MRLTTAVRRIVFIDLPLLCDLSGLPGASEVIGIGALMRLNNVAVSPCGSVHDHLRHHGLQALRTGLLLTSGLVRSRRLIDPGREHYFSPIWVLVSNAAIGLPVIDLRNRVDTRGG